MKDQEITEILNQSIRQEILVSDFYALFESRFSEHAEFWFKLSQEELNHSAILRAERDEFYQAGLLPDEFVQSDPGTLRTQNTLLADFLEQLRISTPSIEQAFSIGICLEGAIIESIYRSCLAEYPQTRAIRVFRLMVGDERAHIARILQYASDKAICIDKNTSLETIAASCGH